MDKKPSFNRLYLNVPLLVVLIITLIGIVNYIIQPSLSTTISIQSHQRLEYHIVLINEVEDSISLIPLFSKLLSTGEKVVALVLKPEFETTINGDLNVLLSLFGLNQSMIKFIDPKEETITLRYKISYIESIFLVFGGSPFVYITDNDYDFVYGVSLLAIKNSGRVACIQHVSNTRQLTPMYIDYYFTESQFNPWSFTKKNQQSETPIHSITYQNYIFDNSPSINMSTTSMLACGRTKFDAVLKFINNDALVTQTLNTMDKEIVNLKDTFLLLLLLNDLSIGDDKDKLLVLSQVFNKIVTPVFEIYQDLIKENAPPSSSSSSANKFKILLVSPTNKSSFFKQYIKDKLVTPYSDDVVIIDGNSIEYFQVITILNKFKPSLVVSDGSFEEETTTSCTPLISVNCRSIKFQSSNRMIPSSSFAGISKCLNIDKRDVIIDFLYGSTRRAFYHHHGGNDRYTINQSNDYCYYYGNGKSSEQILLKIKIGKISNTVAFKSYGHLTASTKELTYKELMSLTEVKLENKIPSYGYQPHVYNTTSTYGNKNKVQPTDTYQRENTIAIVIGAWRRPKAIVRIIDSLLAQEGVIITDIFVSTFASPTEKEYDNIMIEKYTNHPIVRFVKGKPQLIYWGRIQQVLHLTNARYISIVDDDCLPRPLYYRSLIHHMHTDLYGIQGAKGIIVPRIGHTFSGGEFFSWQPEKVIEVDLVGGIWFMELDWLRLCFRERLTDWSTGEDYYISYLIKKYAASPTYLSPFDPNNREMTYFASEDYFQISASGDTTTDRIQPKRRDIWVNIFSRGHDTKNYPLFNPDVIFLVEDDEQAKIMSNFLYTNLTYKVVVINEVSRSAILEAMRISEKQSSDWYDMKIGWDYYYIYRIQRPVDVYHEASMAINQILLHQKPKLVVLPFDENSRTKNIATHSIAITAFHLGYSSAVVPIGNYVTDSSSAMMYRSLLNLGVKLENVQHMKELVQGSTFKK
eukprot:TRINITY_DN8104_c0_g1_i1.p1 TRINITY_DN8104_c0_g1~~TRINITY_DN8104_c0_g1_i1.p1  ORF type:complete len:980 (+),score=178.13 TRINITY_DN8104_c0_g1_i1:22-2940(+)